MLKTEQIKKQFTMADESGAVMCNNCKEALKLHNPKLGITRNQARKDCFDKECSNIRDEKNEAYKAKHQRRAKTAIDRYRYLQREEKRIHRLNMSTTQERKPSRM